MPDLVFRAATVVDGSGGPAYHADVAVADGRIVAIGRPGEVGAGRREVDAAGLTLAPGFIDSHTHYDAQLGWDPLATSSCWHGVTTVLTGNCGYSLAPVRPADRDYTLDLFGVVEDMAPRALQAGVDWRWETWPEWQQIAGRRLGVNLTAYVGHSALRRFVMGEAAIERPANMEERAQMKALLAEALAAGAAGLSTSRSPTHFGPNGEPVPSRLASEAELLELLETLAEQNRGVLGVLLGSATVGLSAEDRDLLLRLALRCRRPVIAQGLGSVGFRWDDPSVWPSQRAFLEDASARGAEIYGQVQTHSFRRPFSLVRGSPLDRLPTWKAWSAAPLADKHAQLADAEVRARLFYEATHQREIQLAHHPFYAPIHWDLLVVRKPAQPRHAAWEGRRLVEMAAERNLHPADAVLEIAAEEDFATEFISSGWAPEDVPVLSSIFHSPYSILGSSDGGAHLAATDGAEFSSFFLAHWVREQKLMTLEEAVRRLTSMPAQIVGLTDRGRIAEGFAADLVLFDAQAIRPDFKAIVNDLPAGAPRWSTRPLGIKGTWVNGEALTEDGAPTGALPGRFLRPGSA